MIAWLWVCLLAPPNVVADGDFERSGLEFGVGQAAGGWKILVPTAAEYGTLTLSADEGVGGSRCAAYRREADGSSNIHLDQVLDVTPNTVYRVSAQVRGDGRLSPLLTIARMDWKQLAIEVVPPETAWQRVELVFDSGDQTQVRLEWFAGATGTLYSGVAGRSWLDDVVVVPWPEAPETLRRAFGLARPQPAPAALPPAQPLGTPTPLRPLVCRDGVLEYEGGGEVALWGLNIQTPLSWEWRQKLQRVGVPQTAEALNAVLAQNIPHFGQLGVGVVRAHLLPSDFTDADGHLVDTIYLDALDYLIAECARRGIYVYLTLINVMGGPAFCPDSFMTPDREQWLFDEAWVAHSQTYVGELLRHVNRYTGQSYATEPALGVLEIMNEPGYLNYPDLAAETTPLAVRERFATWLREHELAGLPTAGFAAWRYELVRRYLTDTIATIRATGARQPVFWNLNWSRYIVGREDIFQATADSPVDGVSVCCYPGQSDVKSPFWDHPAELTGRNYLPFLAESKDGYDRLGWLLTRRFAGKARSVYEFETMYQQSRYLYPAMARMFRGLGVQMAMMWEYTLTPTAPYQSGSHYLNLECTPAKAASFRIGSEVFRATPRGAPFILSEETRLAGDDWAVSAVDDTAWFRGPGVWLQTGPQPPTEPVPAGLRELFGVGDSAAVSWPGTGTYQVLIAPDAITVRLAPDVTVLRELWKRPPGQQQPTVALDHEARHRLELRLPGWSGPCRVTRDGEPVANAATGIAFEAQPGEYRIERG